MTRTRRRFVTLTALRWFPTGVVLPVLVLLLRARGLDLATVGVLLAIYSLVTASLELPTGALADAVGRRPVLAAAGALTVVGSLMFAVGSSLLVLGLASAVLGCARALDSGPLQAWYVDSLHAIDEDADLKPGLSQAGVAEAAGLGLGALVGGALVTVSPLPSSGGSLIALSTPFLLAGALAGLHLTAVVWWVREPVRARHLRLRLLFARVPTTIAGGAALTARRGSLRRIVLFSAALGVVLAGVELLAPNSFAALLGGASEAAGPYAVLVALGFLGTAAGAALAPAAARMLHSSSRAALASTVAAAIALLGVAGEAVGLAATAYLSFYLLLGIGGPLVDELTHVAVTSAERATVLSVRSMVLQGGGIVATLGVGALAGATSFVVGFAALSIVLGLGALALARMPAPVSGSPDRTPLGTRTVATDPATA